MLCLGVNDMSREMKDSGVEWIGEIPEDWNVERLQWHLQEINKPNNPVETEYILSLNNKTGVIPYEERDNMGNKAKEDYSQYKIAYPDTLVMNSMNVIIGSVGISHYYGCISPVYYVFKASDKTELRYINYVFKIERFQKDLRKYANGILEIRLRISVHDTLRRLIPIPSYEEQCKIADFLDKRCEKIDRLIQKQQEYCELLNQYKYSLYTEKAKKLNCKRTVLGRIVKNIEQGWSPAPAERNEDGNWNVLTLAAVKYGEFISDEIKCFNGSIEKCGNLSLKRGDFLLTRSNTRELVGQVCIVDEDMEKTIFSDLIYRITFDRRYVDPEYLKYYFQTAMMRQQISRDAHGSSSTMVKITHKDIKMWEVELPTLVEQKKYVNEMKKKTAIINKLLNNHNQYTELLKDYKKNLIYEYVTGKKGVPEF